MERTLIEELKICGSNDMGFMDCNNTIKNVTINDYENKVEMSKTAGRKKKVNDKQIYDMAREGKTASQIALELGCSKATVDKNEGWKNRKIDDFVF